MSSRGRDPYSPLSPPPPQTLGMASVLSHEETPKNPVIEEYTLNYSRNSLYDLRVPS